MKKLIGALFIFSFLLAGSASAQMMGGRPSMMGGYWTNNGTAAAQAPTSADLNTALQNIYQSQNVSNQSQLSCSKVSDDQFEKLGDAVMGYGITEQQHTAMENMMGGEGSATLRQAHINMGRSYLGCWANYSGAPAYMPMMGYFNGSTSTPQAYVWSGHGMINGFYGNGMMGRYYGGVGWFGIVTMVLIWILLILGILVVIKWLRKK